MRIPGEKPHLCQPDKHIPQWSPITSSTCSGGSTTSRPPAERGGKARGVGRQVENLVPILPLKPTVGKLIQIV